MAHKTIALTTELREPCYTMCNQLILSVRVHMCRVVAFGMLCLEMCQGDSDWCLDVTSTHGVQ